MRACVRACVCVCALINDLRLNYFLLSLKVNQRNVYNGLT